MSLMAYFHESKTELLLNKLQNEGSMPVEQAEAVVHALADIEGSMEQIYGVFLPKLLTSATRDELQHALWDMREEFRHIEYHLEQAKLADL